MSPLAPAGARGYPPWQRIANYDGGTLFSEVSVLHAGSWSTAVYDVSRYGYLGGYFDCSGGNGFVATVSWYADAGGTILLGQRPFVTHSVIAAIMQLRVANLGPFVQVTFALVSGSVTASNLLFPTNRVHPLEVIPAGPLLVDQQNVSIGSGVNLTANFAGYLSGPASWWVQSSNATFTVSFEAWTGGGVWDFIYSVPFTTADVSGSFTFPATPCRLVIANTGGGGTTIFAAVVPDYSGSS